MKKTKPAIWAGPLCWGWVNLGELAEVVGVTPRETFQKFVGLSKEAGGLNCVLPDSPDESQFVWDSMEVWEVTDQFRSVTEEIRRGDVWVPAGWALDVISAHNAGIARVVLGKATLDAHPSPGHMAWTLGPGAERYEAIGLRADGSPLAPAGRRLPLDPRKGIVQEHGVLSVESTEAFASAFLYASVVLEDGRMETFDYGGDDDGWGYVEFGVVPEGAEPPATVRVGSPEGIEERRVLALRSYRGQRVVIAFLVRCRVGEAIILP